MAAKVSVAPKGMGLNDFVAMQEGFFRDEGLDVEFDMKTMQFRVSQGTTFTDVKGKGAKRPGGVSSQRFLHWQHPPRVGDETASCTARPPIGGVRQASWRGCCETCQDKRRRSATMTTPVSTSPIPARTSTAA